VDKYLKESISMAINIFEPLKFSTQGINDLATKTSLVVSDGKITVDTVEPTKTISFAGGSFAEVEGKGIKWFGGNKNKTLAFKQSKLWTDLSVNLADEQSYEIDNTPVLSFGELGPTVTKSNLKTVGTLKNLNVAGDTTLGEFAIFSADLNRLGINTEAPGAAIGIRENNVSIIIGSIKNNTASIGTVTNDSLEIITDNTARITVSNNGDVRVHGTIYAEEVITQRSSPLVWKETSVSTNYGKGIIWSNLQNNISQFVYQASPDRIWSTDIIDLEQSKYFAIGKIPVLSQGKLGDTVIESSLQKLGVLTELQVAGDAAVTRTLSTSRISIGGFSITENLLDTQGDFSLVRNNQSDLSIGDHVIIGNTNNQQRTVSVYGQMTVGVARPDPGIGLTVAGPVSFDNKKFIVGNGVPNNGQYNKGDIVWNNDPKATDYIGWVCVTPGEPGRWLPFGAIAAQ
jgi:hypothetical protein